MAAATTAMGTSVHVPVAVSNHLHSSHAVCRSAEFLSCAKTAVKLAQRRHAAAQQQHEESPSPQQPAVATKDEWWVGLNPSHLRLYDPTQSTTVPDEVLEDGLALLRTMDTEIKHLEALVRRRGHTNDPTTEIAHSVQRLQTDASDLKELIQHSLIPKSVRRGQRQKHYQVLQQWFQSVADQQSHRLKEILKVRATVLAEQAKRRQDHFVGRAAGQASTSAARTASMSLPLSVNHNKNNSYASVTPKSSSGNPLFHLSPPPTTPTLVPPPPPAAATANQGNAQSNGGINGTVNHSYNNSSNSNQIPTAGRNGHHHPKAAMTTRRAPVATSAYGYYGGVMTSSSTTGAGYGGGGYGATTAAAHTGMRQRKAISTLSSHPDGDDSQANSTAAQDYQQQILLRQQERQTQQRLHEARQAERTLADLGSLFGKMSTLISQQSETIDKVEDDVESALLDVRAGHEEITTLYSIKKGNRGLILKVFGLLIFFIIFMRFYRK